MKGKSTATGALDMRVRRFRVLLILHPSSFILFALTALGSLSGGVVYAQSYPTKPVRLVVGFPPGGAGDILARMAAQPLSVALHEQVVVDNRGGAGGLVATEIVAHSVADGYTLLFASIPQVINPFLYKKVDYDPIRDFDAVVQFVAAPLLLATNVNVPAKTVGEFIALAKSRPGQINYGSGGSGSSSHLAMELFKSMAGIDLVHIPYKGTGPMFAELIGGQLSATIASAVPLIPQVRAGKLRGLAVTGAKRAAAMPDLPTIGETVRGYEVTNWFGLVAPRGTSKAIIARINAELNQALKNPALKELLGAQGAESAGGTPDEFAALIKRDYAKWGKVVKASGARVD
jgi:tripartite-type tricarboxylate transporter receptor subunit TctC